MSRPYKISVIQGARSRSKVRTQGPVRSLGPRPVGQTLGPDLIIYLQFKVRGLGPRSELSLKVQVQTWKPRSQTCRLHLRSRPYNISVIQSPRCRSRSRSRFGSLGPRPVGRTLGPDLIIHLQSKVRGLGPRSDFQVRTQGPGLGAAAIAKDEITEV